LLDGFTMEFFPEGGRSRTGRLLAPKLGMFKYVVETWRLPNAPDVSVVPVAIDYEKIIEQASYQAELAGGAKKNESISGLLKTRNVLRSRYGRVYVRFGAPIRLSDFAARRLVAGGPDGTRCSEDEVGEISRALGHQVMYEIGRAATVTASAVVASILLHHGAGDRRQRGLRREAFYERAKQLIGELRWLSAPLSSTLQSPDEALDEALARFTDERRVTIQSAFKEATVQIINVPEEQRVGLSYYQNAITAHVVAHAIVAAALLGKPQRILGDLQQRAYDLSRLLKYEFSFRADQSFSALFGGALSELVAQGIARSEPDGSFSGDQERVLSLYGFLEATIGAYVSALHAVEVLREFPLWERELTERVLEHTRLFALEGVLRTPESVQKTLATGAVSWLKDLGVVAPTQGKTLGLSERYASGDALTQLRDYYDTFLNFRPISAHGLAGEPPRPTDAAGESKLLD
jgi:glycerol-3-phosphate O-acyltransferase